MVGFFLNELEPLLLVDVPGGVEHAVRPERQGLVAAATGETDAFFDEAGTQAQTPRSGLDQEKPEPGNRIAAFDYLAPG